MGRRGKVMRGKVMGRGRGHKHIYSPTQASETQMCKHDLSHCRIIFHIMR